MTQEEIQQVLDELGQIDERINTTTSGKLFDALLRRKQAVIDQIILATEQVPYWTEDGYRLRPLEEYA